MFCGACAIRVSPSPVQVDGIVETRPQSRILPLKTSGDRWRKIEVSIAKENVQSLRKYESTFFVNLTDCASKDLGTQELYINGVSIAQLSSLGHVDFDTFYAALRDPVKGYVYLKESIYANEPRICALFDGGSMTGAKVWSSQFQIK